MQPDDCPRCADLRARLAALRAMLLVDPACNPDGRPAAATVRAVVEGIEA